MLSLLGYSISVDVTYILPIYYLVNQDFIINIKQQLCTE